MIGESGNSIPSFSVVICTRNRPAPLRACVESAVGQSRLPIELIVVDDGELGDEELDRLRSLCASAGVGFVYMRKQSPGLPQSRNLAVRHARGEIVQFLDDDVTLEPGFFEEVFRLYADDTEGQLIGTDGTLIPPTFAPLGARLFDWLYRLAGWWSLRPRRRRRLPLPPALARHRGRARPILTIVGATMAFRRSALTGRKFDEGLSGYALGEDRDMAYQLAGVGTLARVDGARAVHHHTSAGRPDSFSLGRMVVRNYVRTMGRAGLTGVGDRLIIAYSLATIAVGLLCFSCVRPRRYFPEFLGMAGGGAGLIRDWLRAALS